MRFHHLAIQVRDLTRAEAFYVGLLGLPVVARHADAAGAPRSIWVGTGEGFLALELCTGEVAVRAFRDPAPGLHLLSLAISPGERDALEAKLAAAGHPRVHETAFTFYVLDPEGNRLGFSHFPEPRA